MQKPVVFIAYSHADSDATWVRKLARSLKIEETANVIAMALNKNTATPQAQ